MRVSGCLLLKAFLISIFGMTVHAAVTVKLSAANTLRLSQPQEMCQKNCCRGGKKKNRAGALFVEPVQGQKSTGCDEALQRNVTFDKNHFVG